MKKFFMALVAVLGAMTAWAEDIEVTYIDADGKEKTVTATVVDFSGGGIYGTKGEEHWYVVNDEVKIAYMNFMDDHAHLILADGAKLTVDDAILGFVFNAEKNLTIYGQKEGTGQLIASAGNIGYSICSLYGDITINGGIITAITDHWESIGILAEGKITINGGSVTATSSGEDADGIYTSNGDITVNGGTVTATGGTKEGSGIKTNNGNIIINGGSVTAASSSEKGSGVTASGTTTLAGGVLTSDKYSGAVSIADGFTYSDGANLYNGTLDDEQKGAIAGKTMQSALLSLNDNAVNSVAIAAYDGKLMVARLSGRMLNMEGNWNTLTLPFNVDAFAGTHLEGATVKELDTEGWYDAEGTRHDEGGEGLRQTGYDSESGTLTLYFKDAAAIEAGKPYLVKWESGLPAALTVNSAEDWNTFASNINNGTESYEGKLVKLGADIDVTTTVGTSEHPFRGIFDGAGHTMNVTLDDTDNRGTAPFRYISDAIIQNVRTTGTVSGRRHCTGLVGYAYSGTNTIQNCQVAVSVTSTEKWFGGVLGHGMSSITAVANCLFTGSLTGPDDAIIGVFDAWNDEGTHSIENCLENGTYGITVKTAGKDNVTVKNCYGKSGKVADATDASGMSSEVLQAVLGSEWETADGDVVPKLAPTSIFNPVFNAVVISKNNTPVTSGDGNVEFRGNYDPTVLPGDDVSNLYLGSGNHLFWPVNDKTINAFRAYFHVNLGPEQMVHNIVMNLDIDDPTAVEEIKSSMFNVQCSMDNGPWYDLSGRKYDSKPTKPGIYVHNGEKIVVN